MEITHSHTTYPTVVNSCIAAAIVSATFNSVPILSCLPRNTKIPRGKTRKSESATISSFSQQIMHVHLDEYMLHIKQEFNVFNIKQEFDDREILGNLDFIFIILELSLHQEHCNFSIDCLELLRFLTFRYLGLFVTCHCCQQKLIASYFLFSFFSIPRIVNY